MSEFVPIIKARDSWVREAVDPHGELPPVQLRLADQGIAPEPVQHTSASVGTYGIEVHDQLVGKLHLLHIPREKASSFIGIAVNHSDPQSRPRYGRAAYVLAIEQSLSEGRTFETDATVSGSAKKVWDVLIQSGVAELEEDFRLLDEGRSPHLTTYTGFARVYPKNDGLTLRD